MSETFSAFIGAVFGAGVSLLFYAIQRWHFKSDIVVQFYGLLDALLSEIEIELLNGVLDSSKFLYLESLKIASLVPKSTCYLDFFDMVQPVFRLAAAGKKFEDADLERKLELIREKRSALKNHYYPTTMFLFKNVVLQDLNRFSATKSQR